jgi:Cu2+-containing amine oxidase
MKFYELNSQMPGEAHKHLNTRGGAFHHTETLIRSEIEARRQMNFATGRLWKICSSNKKNRMG